MPGHVVIDSSRLMALAQSEAVVVACPAFARYRATSPHCGSCTGTTPAVTSSEAAEREVRAALATADLPLRTLILALLDASSAEILSVHPLTGELSRTKLSSG